jgi:hypothetical protein
VPSRPGSLPSAPSRPARAGCAPAADDLRAPMTSGPPASRPASPAPRRAPPATPQAPRPVPPATPPPARPVPPPARRLELIGRAGLAASLASVLLTFAVAAAGPSVMEPALPGGAGQPPWSFGLGLPAGLAIGLAAAALALGAAGLGLCLHAARHGWAVAPRLLLGAGLAAAAALALVPPFGSGDHLSYAAYGRMAVTGHDPYTTTAAMLARLGDPVARAVQDWRHSPSVYGSVATGFQALAAAAGGRSVRLTVFVLSLVNVAAFAGTGLLAHRLARGCRGRQLRAALLWTANPLLLQVLVAGAHVDGQAVFFAVSALALCCLSLRYAPRATMPPAGTLIRGHVRGRWRQRPQKNVVADANAHIRGQVVAAQAGPVTPETALPPAPSPGRLLCSFLIAAGAGAAAGLAFAVKVSLLLVLAGLILAAALALFPRDRSRWQPFAVVTGGLLAGFAAIAAAAFLPWGTQALGPALHAGSYVSIGSPWRPVRSALRLLAGEATADDLVRAGAVILAAALLALFARPLAALAREYRGGPAPGLGRPVAHPDAEFCPRPGDLPDGPHRPPEPADGTTLAAASVLAVVLAWLVAWTYVLPWYDSLAWAFLAILPWLPVPWAALDWLVLARTTVLALAYLPARGIALPAELTWTRTVVRSGVTPVLLLALTVTLALVAISGWPVRQGGARSSHD